MRGNRVDFSTRGRRGARRLGDGEGFTNALGRRQLLDGSISVLDDLARKVSLNDRFDLVGFQSVNIIELAAITFRHVSFITHSFSTIRFVFSRNIHACILIPRVNLMEISLHYLPATTLRTPPSTAMISPLTYWFLARKSCLVLISREFLIVISALLTTA